MTKFDSETFNVAMSHSDTLTNSLFNVISAFLRSL